MIRGLIFAIATLFASVAMADSGKQLHDAACLNCHASLTGGKPDQMYLRSDRKVKSLAGLQQRVAYCMQAADVNWNAAQQAAVVDYLRSQFYGF